MQISVYFLLILEIITLSINAYSERIKLYMKQTMQIIKDNIAKLFLYKPQNEYEFELSSAPEKASQQDISYPDDTQKILPDNQKIYPNIDVNLEYVKIKYNYLINNDITIREFTLYAKDKAYRAFLLYIDGMISTADLNDFILKPLMFRNKDKDFGKNEKIAITNNISIKKTKKFNLEDYIYNSLMPQNSVKRVENFSDIIGSVNMGNTALFVDTLNIVFNIDLKGFEHRSISTPNNEVVIRGAQESFVEVIRTNTSMLRRIVNNQNLIIEETDVGNITKTRVAICYMKNITNNDLVAEVKFRINNLDVDYITSSGHLEKLIQDNPKVAFPQMISTERPDKAANNLLEGRVVVLINGSPYALIMPAVLVDFLSSPEDINLKFQYSDLLRFIRVAAFLITLLLPGLYIAITSYHEELIPTELLFAMASARENVPFPIIVELIIMEFAFEVIREASIRVPSPIGPTMGIVGALILGEAAVSANVVSPILIIVVALTAICSFAIPDYSLHFTLRINRFVYIILGYLAGFLGICLGLFVHIIILAGLKSFGVPYLASNSSSLHYTRGPKYFPLPIFKQEERANYLNTKRKYKQGSISRKWEQIRSEGGTDE